MYAIDISVPQKKAENVYEISYRVTGGKNPSRRKIVRVELAAGGEVLAGKIGNNLLQGVFVLDLNQHPELIATDFALNLFAWDDTFNCVSSIERFIIR